jgi:hypothetical protein
MILPTLVAIALSGEPAEPQEPLPPPPLQKAETTTATDVAEDAARDTQAGGAFAPPVLPRGSMAVYALLGAPDIGGGYRQGFSQAELEVRLWFNYLAVGGVLEVGGKRSVYHQGILELVPNLALGIEGNSGSRYYDKANFAYVALRPRAAVIGGVRFSELATGLVVVDLPWSIALTNGGAGGHFSPTLGVGAEMQLSGTLSGLLLGQIGVDVIKEPLGVTQVRPAWAVRLGLGFRLF